MFHDKEDQDGELATQYMVYPPSERGSHVAPTRLYLSLEHSMTFSETLLIRRTKTAN